MPPAVIDGFARFKIRRERKIPGLVLTKVTLTREWAGSIERTPFRRRDAWVAGSIPLVKQIFYFLKMI
jgi:hypothetical protein